MSKICYQEKNFSPATLATINQANEIIETYQEQGYQLTLRQLYYQFVSRDLIANKVTEYKRLGSILNDARLAGLVDWTAIEDRTRNLASLAHWEEPADIIRAASKQYRIDKWESQPCRIEVWIEKEALAGVFERVCQELDVPFLCCRGYTSQSEMWAGAQRLINHYRDGKEVYVLHFGDHDPSGIDMTRDIRDRLEMFGCNLQLERLALNMDQVDEYKPPPNPAKETDSRFAGYIRQFGDESWELDALEPQVLADLVRNKVFELRDLKKWKVSAAREERERSLLVKVSNRWHEVATLLKGKPK